MSKVASSSRSSLFVSINSNIYPSHVAIRPRTATLSEKSCRKGHDDEQDHYRSIRVCLRGLLSRPCPVKEGEKPLYHCLKPTSFKCGGTKLRGKRRSRLDTSFTWHFMHYSHPFTTPEQTSTYTTSRGVIVNPALSGHKSILFGGNTQKETSVSICIHFQTHKSSLCI